jgi:septal ring factor EnvC (AmiA/AmiB activator)
MTDSAMEEKILQLCEGVSSINAKIDTMQKDLDAVKAVQNTVTAHTTHLEQIDISLQRGNQKFQKLDDRLDKVDGRLDELEQVEGERAKSLIKTVGHYLLTAAVGFVISAVGFYVLNK